MKICHFFPYGTFITKYVEGFKNNDSQDYEHIFYFYGDIKGQKERHIYVCEYGKMIFSEYKFDNLEEYIKNSDIVVINCIPEDIKIITMINNYVEKYKKNTVVVSWGRDLFRTSDFYRINNESEIEKLDIQKRKMFLNCKIINTSYLGEKYLNDFYKVKKPVIWFDSLYMDVNIDFRNKNFIAYSDRVNVMVGHRGTFTSKHLEIFEILRNHIQKIDKVICPLSYGNIEYIRQIIEKGKEYFGEKFVVLDKWMESKEYFEYLDENIDVAIFNTETSEGYNNQLFLISRGKKIYMNPQNEDFEGLERTGYPIYKIDDLNKNGEIGSKLTKNEIDKVYKANQNYSENFGFDKWYEIFNNINNYV